MIINKGQYATFKYPDSNTIIIEQPGEKQQTLTLDEFDQRQREIDAVRNFRWTNPYKGQ